MATRCHSLLPHAPRAERAAARVDRASRRSRRSDGGIEKRCIERGEESELIFVGFHSALLQVWRGNLAEAELVSDDSMERALQLGGDLPLFIALTVRSMIGAYAGRVDQVRRDTAEAIAAGQRCASHRLGEWPITNLAFLEVSLGNYEAALRTLAPLHCQSRQDAAIDGDYRRNVHS